MMKQIKKIRTYDTHQLKIPIQEQRSIFIHLHSEELKYMNPWNYYDDEELEEKTFHSLKKRCEIQRQINGKDKSKIIEILVGGKD